ncbi:MAG: polymer-forming cytoskeletal protein [Ktedonobacteraceae bacterium]|nr:polymer-forming cytoskeletal protein [Ktedonobacteraceae bacterium]
MRNVTRTQRFLPILIGLLLMLVCVAGGGWRLLTWLAPATPTQGKQAQAGGGECTPGHHGPSFGGNVVINNNEVVCTDLISFGGTVVMNGEVKGNVVSFGSNVIIDGTIDGTINQYGGLVTLQNGSHVHGDIHLYGGQWAHGNDAQLDGAVIDHTQRFDWLFAGHSGFAFPFWSMLTWIALGLVLTWLLPEHVMFVRTTIMSRAQRSLIIGLLSAPLAPALLIVLIALILPIPLAIIVALGLIAAWALGTVAMGWLIGEYVVHRLAPERNTRPVQVIVGLTILILAGSLPYIGWLIGIAAGLLGLGAVLLSRFGTRLYGQPRHPLTL